MQNIIQNDPRIGRKQSFQLVVAELLKRWPNSSINIVETGTTRKKENENIQADGGSTVLWGIFAKLTDSRVWTCDISVENIYEARRWTKGYESNITYVVADSVGFLQNFPEKINLLYLDSRDSSEWDRSIIDPSCAHQLREAEAAIDKLADNALILLDDVPTSFRGGKSEKSIPFFLECGWCIVHHIDNQVLLSKYPGNL